LLLFVHKKKCLLEDFRMNGQRPSISSVHGIVAAAHPLAAAAGARILSEGGNAFDAAVAVAAALGVVEPFMSGIAGSGVATVYAAAERRVRCLQFRGGVPVAFPVGRYSRREEMYRGAMAATAPGNLAGWCAMLERYGSRSLAEVLAPAVALARDGVPLIDYSVASINASAEELGAYPFFNEWRRVYQAGGGAVRAGQVLRQPDLAATFAALGAEGPGLLYGGALGERLLAHLATLGGCLSMADLLAVRARWVEPASAAYRTLVVHAPPPPCSAYQFLLGLRILDGFNLTVLPRDGVEHLDLLWRALRLAAGVRVQSGIPSAERLAELLGEPAVALLRARVTDGLPVEGPTEQWIAPPEGKVAGQHTTSLSVADGAGNVVCLTQSLGARFGCGVVVPGTGLCLSNALYWGELDQRGPNALVPGGQLATSMSPSIALRNGLPVLALGTPGSYGITQTQVQALVQHVDFALPIQAAIEAPRARLWDGRRVQAESRIAPEVLAELAARGHAVEAPAAWTPAVGGMQGIALDPRTGVLTGGGDPRREGYVVPV
jgi:gamma-glutamyltranspeptidase/glutathione hydrolase